MSPDYYLNSYVEQYNLVEVDYKSTQMLANVDTLDLFMALLAQSVEQEAEKRGMDVKIEDIEKEIAN